MLVLTRSIDEFFHIITPSGERISIAINEIKGKQIRVGVLAGKDIVVIRDEMFKRIEARGYDTSNASAIRRAMTEYREGR